MRALAFVGGCTAKLVPDNLKSGVTDPWYYDPVLNRSYHELARHYGIAIVPTACESAKLCAIKVHDRLGEADWMSQRDLIRTLVRRVEVARDQVNIVFRVDPYPEESDPEKKSLQLCRGSEFSTARKYLPP